MPPTPVITVRKCEVSFTDARGFTHRITVHTSSVMQAAAHALKVLEEGELLEGCSLTGEATVEVLSRTAHTISLSRLRGWLESGGSPKEVAMKRELRERKPPQR